jgi:phosphoribosylaminoimidazole (AIR) synthetase
MVVIVAATQVDAALRLLQGAGEQAQLIGEVQSGSGGVLIEP